MATYPRSPKLRNGAETELAEESGPTPSAGAGAHQQGPGGKWNSQTGSPSSVLLTFFGWKASPTKIDYRKRAPGIFLSDSFQTQGKQLVFEKNDG